MSGYTPNNFDITNPTDAVIAETAQAEFRNMKSFFQGTIGRNANLQSISNSTGNLTSNVTIPANCLGINRKLRAKARGIVNNGTGGSQNLNVNILLGATLLVSTSPVIPIGNDCYFETDIELMNGNAVNVQNTFVKNSFYAVNSATGIPPGGFQSISGGNPVGVFVFGTAIDTTIAQVLSYNVALNAASVTLGLFLFDFLVEWL